MKFCYFCYVCIIILRLFMKRFISFFAFLMLFAYFAAFSQETKMKTPFESFGVGVELQSEDIIYGGTLSYAMNSYIHIGVNFGLYFDGGAEGSGSSTFLTFGPYMKYFLSDMRVKSFFPYLKGQFLVSTTSEPTYDVSSQKWRRITETNTKLILFVGSEWFPISSLGIYGGMRALELQLDPVKFRIGTMFVTLGIEWFL